MTMRSRRCATGRRSTLPGPVVRFLEGIVENRDLTRVDVRRSVLSRFRSAPNIRPGKQEAQLWLRLVRAVELDRPAHEAMSRWYETVGLFLPRKKLNVGASRVVPDHTRLLGWLGDVWDVLEEAPAAGGEGVLARYEAWYEREHRLSVLGPDERLELYLRRQDDQERRAARRHGEKHRPRGCQPMPAVDEYEEAARAFHRLEQRVAFMVGFAWFAAAGEEQGLWRAPLA